MTRKTDSIQFTDEIPTLVFEIDELKGVGRALGRLSALRRIATIESIGSSTRTEGRKERGRVAIGNLLILTGTNRNTVKKHLATLIDATHLSQNRTGKGIWYGSYAWRK